MDSIARIKLEIAAPAEREAHRSAPISAAERERLILEHLPQVRLIASRIHDRLPVNVGLEDLVSTGIAGLMSALDGFDSRHNVKLRTYAEYRIRGAILDRIARAGLGAAPAPHTLPADRSRHRRGAF